MVHPVHYSRRRRTPEHDGRTTPTLPNNLRISVVNFGPIKKAELELSRFMVLIGPQSSGKSTLAKLVYFFLQLRDQVTEFVLAECQGAAHDRKDTLQRLRTAVRARFAEFFGPARTLSNTRVICEYRSGLTLEVGRVREHFKYVEPQLPAALITQIEQLIAQARQALDKGREPTALISSVGRIASEQTARGVVELIREKCNQIFGYDKELLFVPAGRSVLSTLSDQLQQIHPHLLDYPMRRFIDNVNRTRIFFDKSLDDLVTTKRALTSDRVHGSAIRDAKDYVQRILRGEYRFDKEGGKIFIDSNTFTKISFASSGQQESVWILLSLFLLVLENARALIIVEEPEAHLFPDTQKDMIEFIAYVFNQVGCDAFITTHSPYMLARINNLIYARELRVKVGERVDAVIDKKVQLDPAVVNGYFVSNGGVQMLRGRAGPFLRNELLDGASDRMNDEVERLLTMERDKPDAGTPRGTRTPV